MAPIDFSLKRKAHFISEQHYQKVSRCECIIIIPYSDVVSSKLNSDVNNQTGAGINETSGFHYTKFKSLRDMPKSWWHTHAVGKSQVLCPNAARMPLQWAKVVGLCLELVAYTGNE